MRWRLAVSALLLILPWALRRRLLNALLGYHIAPGASIGLSLVLLDDLVMAPGCRIGHLNVIKSFDRLRMDANAKIGDLNYMSGIGGRSRKHFADETGRRPELHLGEGASITGRHLFDVSNLVTIGPFTTIAGAGVQVLTHAISIGENRQRSAPVAIGRACFVGARCVILKGAALPDCCVLGANSTLHKAFEETHAVYSGVPAALLRRIDPGSAYFHRTSGFVP